MVAELSWIAKTVGRQELTGATWLAVGPSEQRHQLGGSTLGL